MISDGIDAFLGGRMSQTYYESEYDGNKERPLPKFLLGERRPQNRTNADEIYFARMVHRMGFEYSESFIKHLRFGDDLIILRPVFHRAINMEQMLNNIIHVSMMGLILNHGKG